jgi:RNA polymerase sigma-70 factor (ECF subfamily)
MSVRSLSQAGDKELMRRVQADDTEAFAALYDRLAARAMQIARGVLWADVSRAQDAVQDGFVSIWRARSRYRPELGSVRSWALAIVRNSAIDSWRRTKVPGYQAGELDSVSDRLAAPDDPHVDAVAADMARDVRDLLAKLPPNQREVIGLAFYGQLSHTEIARELQLPVGTVKGRMRLGLTTLRHQLS